jgi:hypothetical protein
MCTAELIGWEQATPPSPRIWTRITRELFISTDRRHLFVTPWLFRIRDYERSLLFLVLQTPSKSFMHSSLPRVMCGVVWEQKSMSWIFVSSYGGKVFLHIFKLEWFKRKQIWVDEDVFICSQEPYTLWKKPFCFSFPPENSRIRDRNSCCRYQNNLPAAHRVFLNYPCQKSYGRKIPARNNIYGQKIPVFLCQKR